MILTTKSQARVQGMVELKDVNSLQMSPNWFLGILDGPWTPSKVGLRVLEKAWEKRTFLSIHQEKQNDFRKEWIRMAT
jgi:hypothetical protein